MTKNAFCFCAPWNIVYIPKIIDPLTGHESKGEYVEEFQILFRKYIINKFQDLISDYNEIIEKVNMKEKIGNYVSDLPNSFTHIYGEEIDNVKRNRIIAQFSKDINNQFKKIEMN